MNRLNEIEARANAATEGPWETEHHYNRLTGEHVVSEIPRVAECMGNGDGGLDYKEDAEFIAHARTDVPALVAALRAVLNLHFKAQPIPAAFGTQEGGDYCVTCAEDWPCPTVETIRQHIGDDL